MFMRRTIKTKGCSFPAKIEEMLGLTNDTSYQLIRHIHLVRALHPSIPLLSFNDPTSMRSLMNLALSETCHGGKSPSSSSPKTKKTCKCMGSPPRTSFTSFMTNSRSARLILNRTSLGRTL